jgi:hypothetical protein
VSLDARLDDINFENYRDHGGGGGCATGALGFAALALFFMIRISGVFMTRKG